MNKEEIKLAIKNTLPLYWVQDYRTIFLIENIKFLKEYGDWPQLSFDISLKDPLFKNVCEIQKEGYYEEIYLSPIDFYKKQIEKEEWALECATKAYASGVKLHNLNINRWENRI